MTYTLLEMSCVRLRRNYGGRTHSLPELKNIVNDFQISLRLAALAAVFCGWDLVKESLGVFTKNEVKGGYSSNALQLSVATISHWLHKIVSAHLFVNYKVLQSRNGTAS